jgi:flagellar biosynthesis/type III secretory pathway protein FliH
MTPRPEPRAIADVIQKIIYDWNLKEVTKEQKVASLRELCDMARAEGYQEGIGDSKVIDAAHDQGFKLGHTQGFSEGKQKGYEEEAVKCHEHCEKARAEGYQEGIGDSKVIDAAHDQGFKMGFSAGQADMLERAAIVAEENNEVLDGDHIADKIRSLPLSEAEGGKGD